MKKTDEMKPQKAVQVVTSDLRDLLKAFMQKEIERLPETLDGLEPRERVNVICKLLPFVFPKINNVCMSAGEPW